MVLKRILDWHLKRRLAVSTASVFEAGLQIRAFKSNMDRFLESAGFDSSQTSFDYQACAFIFARMDEVLSRAGLIEDIEGGSKIHVDIHQKGAIAVLVVQGLHMIFAEAFAPTVLQSEETKRRRADVMQKTLWMILRVGKEGPDDELGALAYGSQLYKLIAASDVPLLQSIYDAWTAWFTSDDA